MIEEVVTKEVGKYGWIQQGVSLELMKDNPVFNWIVRETIWLARSKMAEEGVQPIGLGIPCLRIERMVRVVTPGENGDDDLVWFVNEDLGVMYSAEGATHCDLIFTWRTVAA